MTNRTHRNEASDAAHAADADLRDAVAASFVTFASYALGSVDGCPHCVAREDHACIRSAPLRELSADQLARYAFKAMSTWGTAEDYKHFLPRILELAALDPRAAGYPGFAPDHVFRKVADAGWSTWPEHERAAVDRIARATWRVALHRRDPAIAHAQWLEAFAILDADVAWYLAAWREDVSIEATDALAAFVVSHGDALLSDARGASFRETPAARAQVRRWLLSSETHDRLFDAFCQRDSNRLLADAADVLSAYAR